MSAFRPERPAPTSIRQQTTLLCATSILGLLLRPAREEAEYNQDDCRTSANELYIAPLEGLVEWYR